VRYRLRASGAILGITVLVGCAIAFGGIGVLVAAVGVCVLGLGELLVMRRRVHGALLDSTAGARVGADP
jgi:hypothetical protein